MYKLTANYKIELPQGLRVKRAETDSLCYNTSIDGFDAVLILNRNKKATIKEPDEIHETLFVTSIDVSVSHYEDTSPPALSLNKKGEFNLADRAPWFQEKEDKFRRVAVKVINRLVRFFKYKMSTPRIHEFDIHDTVFNNPKWTNSKGDELPPGIITVVASTPLPSGPELLGERDFTEDEDEKLTYTLQNDLNIETYNEFLSDAQTSILNGKLRRAILEMAISCEIAVKSTFFGKTTISGAVFEYLEDKNRVHIGVIELIHGAARVAFGQSFKDYNPKAYKHIDFLFRARNKVAHRGERIYRDDKGEKHKVDRPILESWWISVDILMNWLNKQSSADKS